MRAERQNIHPGAGEHASCAHPNLCYCECRTCKRTWEDAGRPQPPEVPDTPRPVPTVVAELQAIQMDQALAALLKGSRDLAHMAARFIKLDPAFRTQKSALVEVLVRYVEVCDRVLPVQEEHDHE